MVGGFMLSLILALVLCQDQIEKWVNDLDADNVELRAEAAKQLRALDGSMADRLRATKVSTLEAKTRLDEILVVLDRKAKVSGLTKSYPTVTAEYKDAPVQTVVNDLKKLGIEFTGTLDDLKVTATFKNAPVMEVLDCLAKTTATQWQWHNTGVIWSQNSIIAGGPAVYSSGFRVRLRAIGADRISNFASKTQITRAWVDLVAEPKIEYVSPQMHFYTPPENFVMVTQNIVPCTKQWGLDMGQPLVLTTDKFVNKLSFSGKARVLFQTSPTKLTIKPKETLKHGRYELSIGSDESHHITITGASTDWLAEHVDNIMVVDSSGVQYGGTINSVTYSDETTCKIYICSQTYDMKEIRITFYDEVIEHFIPFEFKDIELP